MYVYGEDSAGKKIKGPEGRGGKNSDLVQHFTSWDLEAQNISTFCSRRGGAPSSSNRDFWGDLYDSHVHRQRLLRFVD